MNHSDVRVFITGGIRRIGRAIALHLASRGAFLFIHYNSSEDEKSSLSRELGERAHFFRANFEREEEVEEMVKEIVLLGGVDVLINNASLFYRTQSLPEILESWDKFFKVNLKIPLLLSYGLSPAMREQGRGKIINIGDIYGELPLRGYTPYCLTKSGILMLTRCLARELAPEIQVNCISPGALLPPEGATEEEMEERIKKIPLQKMGDPLHLAQTVSYLIENDYITGQNIRMDGGRWMVG